LSYSLLNDVTIINFFIFYQRTRYSVLFHHTYFRGQKSFVMLYTHDDKDLHANQPHV